MYRKRINILESAIKSLKKRVAILEQVLITGPKTSPPPQLVLSLMTLSSPKLVHSSSTSSPLIQPVQAESSTTQQSVALGSQMSELQQMAKNFASHNTAAVVKALASHMFSKEELLTRSILGKRSCVCTEFSRPALNPQKLQEFKTIVAEYCNTSHKDFVEKLQNVQKVLRANKSATAADQGRPAKNDK